MHRSKKPEQIVTISLRNADFSLLLSSTKSIGNLLIPLHKGRPLFTASNRCRSLQDQGLHHVAGCTVAGLQRRDRDDRLAIKGARPFMQHVALGHPCNQQALISR